MPFRNQEEALKHRAETLERELAEARDDLTRVSRLRSPIRLFVGGLMITATAGVAGWVVGGPSQTAGAFMVLHAQSVALQGRAELQWASTVTQASGRPTPTSATLAPGTHCELRVDLTQAMGDPVVRSNIAVELHCGQERIYRTKEASTASGTLLGCGLQESEVGTRRYRYRLICTDQSAESGAMQLSVDTDEGIARVWRDGSNPFELLLSVNANSAIRTGVPLLSTREVSGAHGSSREGRISQLIGTPLELGRPVRGLRVGSPCTVHIEPASDSVDRRCVVRIECEGALVYGRDNYGAAACLVVEGQPQAAVDVEPDMRAAGQPADSGSAEAEDPILLLDLAGSRAVIASNRPNGAFMLTIRLSST